MRRGITKKEILSLIERLRENIPNLTIRTSIIVGFPGETEREFEELLSFIREVKFERLGAFIYSKEEGTDAYNFSGQVPDKIKKRRFQEVMSLQQEISKEHNEQLLGREIDVLIDEIDEEDSHLPRPCAQGRGLVIARTQADAPEVDGQVFVRTKRAKPGEFLRVKITDTYEYDLVGEEVESAQ
jgi:ribosomal protein S12 methylthiotransferase